MSRFYAGIGARKTPSSVLSRMVEIGTIQAQNGWTLRSGGAAGADSSFEDGCDLVGGEKQIFLPWEGYNDNKGSVYPLPEAAFQLIDEMWPFMKTRTWRVRTLIARNCQQILGPNLDDPSDLVICWTPNGKVTGGTGYAIQLAMKHKIPVVNLYGTEYRPDLFD